VKTLILPARIDAASAAKAFQRPRMKNLFGYLTRPVKRAPDGLPASIELVWMPTYAFRIALSRAGRHSDIWVSVDGSYGGFALFERLGALREEKPDGEVFPPVLDPQAAEKYAREGLVKYILRKRGPKPNIDSVEEMRLYHTPVWVYYFHRLGKKIDLAVHDAYTGDPMGGNMRIAVLNAFIRRQSP